LVALKITVIIITGGDDDERQKSYCAKYILQHIKWASRNSVTVSAWVRFENQDFLTRRYKVKLHYKCTSSELIPALAATHLKFSIKSAQ